MDQQRFEALQARVKTVERRLWLTLACLAVMAVGLAVSVAGRTAHAQGQAYTFVPYKGEVHWLIDNRTGVTCYIIGSAMDCVR